MHDTVVNSKTGHLRINHPVKRAILLALGLAVMAFGVAFSIDAGLGTSPISSLPYVTAVIFDLSVGTTTIIMNCVFVVIQIIILRKQYDWFQLLQLPAAFIFGTVIDIAYELISPLVCNAYYQQWLLCLIGIFLVALGVSIEISAGLVTTAGEGIVLAICQVTPFRFSNTKMVFDITLVVLSILLGLLYLNGIYGVREGTIAAAVLVGQITKITNRFMKKIENSLFKN